MKRHLSFFSSVKICFVHAGGCYDPVSGVIPVGGTVTSICPHESGTSTRTCQPSGYFSGVQLDCGGKNGIHMEHMPIVAFQFY